MTTIPNEWGTKWLPWQHRLPSNGATVCILWSNISKNAWVYKLQNRHISSACGPGHKTQF